MCLYWCANTSDTHITHVQELVLALHGLVLLYEKDFQFAALRTSDPDSTAVEDPPSVVVMVNPPSEPATPTTDHPRPYVLPVSDAPPTPRAPFPGPIISTNGTTTLSFNSMSCTQIWKGLIFLASDPFPDVAIMAHNIIGEVRDRVRSCVGVVSLLNVLQWRSTCLLLQRLQGVHVTQQGWGYM